MEQPYILSDEEEPEPQRSVKDTKQVEDKGAELIFVGVEHVNEDAEVIFVGMTSHSKPVVSTILNRVTPGSYLRRKIYGHRRRDTTDKLQPICHSTSASEAVTVSALPESELRSTDSPIISKSLLKPDYVNSSPQVVPNNSLELRSPLVTFSNSLPHPGTTLSVGDMNESSLVSKRLSLSKANCENSKRPKLSDGNIGAQSSVFSPSGTFHSATQQSILSNDVDTSLNHVQNGIRFSIALPKENGYFKPISTGRGNGPAKADYLSLASQNKTIDSNKGNLIVLLRDYYYGQCKENEQPEQKTHTTFKCLSCVKVLKNIKFMNHMRHHLELEMQRDDSLENHTTCQHCHWQFSTPFQLQCHIESGHISQEPSSVCKICELSFKTDQILLEHMKYTHKPGEMPYVCQVCNYRSSFFADVETHFRTCHESTKNLLCPFCLKIYKTATPYMYRYRGHLEKNVHSCFKCRLQFLTFKEKQEHKTHYHQMFKKPKQLERLPPETKVVIQVSKGSIQASSVEVASVTVSTSDSEPSCPNLKVKFQKKILVSVTLKQIFIHLKRHNKFCIIYKLQYLAFFIFSLFFLGGPHQVAFLFCSWLCALVFFPVVIGKHMQG